MRRTVFLGLAIAASVVGCDDGYDHRHRRSQESAIVFGLQQSTDAATGKTVTKAGYEYLSLANKGGWSTQIEELSNDDVCIREELDRRIGRPNVGDGGRARFLGSGLPEGGLAIDANGPLENVFEGKAFDRASPRGSLLMFGVDFGFGLPDLGGLVPLEPPSDTLAVTTPAEAGELSVDGAHDVPFAWSTPSVDEPLRTPARVMVSFETDDEQDHGVQLRCFYDEADLAGVVPGKWLAQIGPAGTKGTVTVASHRQTNTYARGGWTIYVVGTIVLREQRFVVR